MTSVTGVRPTLPENLEISDRAASVVLWVRAHLLQAGVVLVAASVYAFFSLHRHNEFGSNAYDLGIFGQGLKGWASGTGPISEIKGPGFSLLGDHFSPITALLAPFYWMFPTIRLLLIAQAVLIALASVPLVGWAKRELGPWPAAAVGVVFCGSFGVASAVAYDFHEVAFAVPMLAFSLTRIAQGRFRAGVIWALPLVLVKEDLGVTVAAIGLVLLLRRQWRGGALLAVFGILATTLEVKVLIPLANPEGQYGYSNLASSFALSNLIHQPPETQNLKVMTLLTTLSVGLFLATRSTLLIVAVPTLAWRLLGGVYSYWTTGYQYSLVLMPILVAALIEVLIRHQRQGREGRRFVRWALAASVAVTCLLGFTFPLGSMVKSSFWHTNPRLPAMQAAVALVPDGATVAATNFLAPQLTDRSTVSMFWGAPNAGSPAWIAADMTDTWPDSPDARASSIQSALEQGYREIYSRDGVVVLHRAQQAGDRAGRS